MEHTFQKMKWGKSKYEIHTLKSEILTGLSRGENLSEIYRNLKSQGKVGSSLPTFIRYGKNIKIEFYKKMAEMPLTETQEVETDITDLDILIVSENISIL
ncbi:hypothetical protein [Kiloniella laminariae]|uniref:hypothetical protein n=1 Tax=Kiloniella laminariae TaxID=454162 RepID=UPI0003670239|nr:hypothetical protein [Kiloniella laminariae]